MDTEFEHLAADLSAFNHQHDAVLQATTSSSGPRTYRDELPSAFIDSQSLDIEEALKQSMDPNITADDEELDQFVDPNATVSGPAETICNRARSTIFDRGHCTFLGHVVLVSKLGNFSSHRVSTIEDRGSSSVTYSFSRA